MNMREDLLHFIWRFRYFNQHELLTEGREALQILFPGELNTDQGPDFRHAEIRLDGTFRKGPIELHIKSSDWLRHAHDKDCQYRSVILHVVWENDEPAPPGGIPVLVLRQRVSKLLLGQYQHWMNSRVFVPCGHQLPQVSEATWTIWKRQLLLSRLQQRTQSIRCRLEENHGHWEETTWWLMARSLGQPVNGAAFEAIARSLPLATMLRQRMERYRLEALLLGQAGLLEGIFEEEYPRILQQEYRYCQAKYGLSAVGTRLSFLRMRPSHFPTIRLAQLAGLLSHSQGWFGWIREANKPVDLARLLAVTATGYWEDHYILGTPSTPRTKRLGAGMRKGILINAFIPLLYAYGSLRGEPAFRNRALRWLEDLGPETNALITAWRRLGVLPQTAAASQALLELKKNHCDLRKCLDCTIGQVLLGQPQHGIT